MFFTWDFENFGLRRCIVEAQFVTCQYATEDTEVQLLLIMYT